MVLDGIGIGRQGILPIDNNHSLALKQVTLKTDDPANSIAVERVEAMTNLISYLKHSLSLHTGDELWFVIQHRTVIPLNTIHAANVTNDNASLTVTGIGEGA